MVYVNSRDLVAVINPLLWQVQIHDLSREKNALYEFTRGVEAGASSPTLEDFALKVKAIHGDGLSARFGAFRRRRNFVTDRVVVV